ncbi:MAG TPA: BatD family protein, partial [Bacteroidia bacterium]|nr:BatD family protein [Bacteroidia bacterium]
EPKYQLAIAYKKWVENKKANKDSSDNSTENLAFKAQAEPNIVGVDEEIQVDYSLNGIGTNFTPPSFAGFKVAGPSQGTSLSIVNGKYSQSITFSYYLIPLSEGTFTIAPATIMVGVKTLSSNPLTIEVVKATVQSEHVEDSIRRAKAAHRIMRMFANTNETPDTTNIESLMKHPKIPDDSINQNLFFKMTSDKKIVYTGQQIILTDKGYNRFPAQYPKFSYTIESPDFSFEYIYRNLKAPLKTKQDTINGKIFTVTSYNMQAIYPKHEGYLKLKAFSVKDLVQKEIHSGNLNSGQTDQGVYKPEAYILKSNEPVFYVKPLPQTVKPFSGLVGRFKVNVSLKNDSVNVGDSIYVIVTITGDGSIKPLNSISYKIIKNLTPISVTLSDSTYLASDGLVLSRRIYKYLFIPKAEDTFETPATSINYFDPYKGKYAELAVPGFTVTATASGKN